jgi:isoleucyl-tRNA synthetase
MQDALRLYLINSPVVKGEPLRFKKEGVFAVVRDVFLPWYNAYRFLVQNVLRLEVEGLAPFRPMDFSTLQKSTNALDRWINSASQSLVFFVRQEMEAYRLYTVSIIECKNEIIPYPWWWLSPFLPRLLFDPADQ